MIMPELRLVALIIKFIGSCTITSDGSILELWVAWALLQTLMAGMKWSVTGQVMNVFIPEVLIQIETINMMIKYLGIPIIKGIPTQETSVRAMACLILQPDKWYQTKFKMIRLENTAARSNCFKHVRKKRN